MFHHTPIMVKDILGEHIIQINNNYFSLKEIMLQIRAIYRDGEGKVKESGCL